MNNRRAGLLIRVGALVIPLMTVGQSSRAQTRARDQFVGAWHLIALEHRDASGKTSRCDCTGMFVFTRDGHAAVQVMDRNPQASSESGYSQGGYEATFGRYVIDERTQTFTLRVDGALVR